MNMSGDGLGDGLSYNMWKTQFYGILTHSG